MRDQTHAWRLMLIKHVCSKKLRDSGTNCVSKRERKPSKWNHYSGRESEANENSDRDEQDKEREKDE